jgi:hypothetical protein
MFHNSGCYQTKVIEKLTGRNVIRREPSRSKSLPSSIFGKILMAHPRALASQLHTAHSYAYSHTNNTAYSHVNVPTLPAVCHGKLVIELSPPPLVDVLKTRLPVTPSLGQVPSPPLGVISETSVPSSNDPGVSKTANNRSQQPPASQTPQGGLGVREGGRRGDMAPVENQDVRIDMREKDGPNVKTQRRPSVRKTLCRFISKSMADSSGSHAAPEQPTAPKTCQPTPLPSTTDQDVSPLSPDGVLGSQSGGHDNTIKPENSGSGNDRGSVAGGDGSLFDGFWTAHVMQPYRQNLESAITKCAKDGTPWVLVVLYETVEGDVRFFRWAWSLMCLRAACHVQRVAIGHCLTFLFFMHMI